jgi:hypothetical protein
MMITELSDKLCEARELSHALLLAIEGKIEEPSAEDAAIERLAMALRASIDEAEAQFEALRAASFRRRRPYSGARSPAMVFVDEPEASASGI